MADTVIRVENLGKKYVIGHQKQERYTALRDVLAEKARSLGQIFSRNGHREDPTHEEFWALKDVSFEIKQGDRLGIIGRNGAGKSTLLKILSRITEPTEGRISIKGRLASLLEVGTGFHPELTGRENIYLNGAILGMSKREIRRKFDEIVAFAEVEKFLDTPVKRYSSGMYVRLAFAVAAHLEPEILIVDEVLAVGDAQFQKKCLGKMEDVSQEGRTVLFVSHNLSAIARLCQTACVLDKGKMLGIDKTPTMLSLYHELTALKSQERNKRLEYIVSSSKISIQSAHVNPNPASVLSQLDVTISFKNSDLSDSSEYSVFICFSDFEKNYFGSVYSRDESIFFRFDSIGMMSVKCKLNFHTFLPGEFQLEAGIFSKYGECKIWGYTGCDIDVISELFNGSPFDGRGGYATHRGQWCEVISDEVKHSHAINFNYETLK